MSNRPGFFSLLAESQRRKEAIRRHTERETQRGTSAAATPSSSRNRSTPDIATTNQTRNSTPTTTTSSSDSSTVILAVPALGNSTAWRSCRPEVGFKGLTDATEQAALLYTRLAEVQNYLDSAENAWDELCTAREQLQNSLDCATSPDESLRFRAVRTLGNIYGQLGDYDMAQKTFLSLCPSLPLTAASFDNLSAWHEIDALLYYLRFATAIGRDLDRVETVAKVLPWATVDVLCTKDRKLSALFSLVRTLNFRGCHEAASRHLEMIEVVSMPKTPLDSEYLLQNAIATAGEGFQSKSQALFVDAFIISSLRFGAWHRNTLDILYHFGRALKARGLQEAALKLLTASCQGFYYTLGASHPRSICVYQELEACQGAGVVMQNVRQLGHCQLSPKRKWSVAYEHNYLITPIELLKLTIAVEYDGILRTLERLLQEKGTSSRIKFDTKRNIAWCAFEQGRLDAASTALYTLHKSINENCSDAVGVEAYRATLASDEAICAAKSSDLGKEFMRQRSKLVYQGFKDFPKERSHQIKAILRRMTTYRLTHLTRDVVFSGPVLFTETNGEILGSGNSADVDTVKIGKTSYARKSIRLPRQLQRRDNLLEDIQREIKIIHALDHPHIVRVLLTYEETIRFSIIMHPLAECDLESYLANKICDTTRQRRMIWKWLACLINTLAYIHSKGIRHKDIKPRNVLVKGEKVYFTDFGSGHMFDDGGNSTTDGVAYGHTRAYCAPEVIKNDSRNRSSDVFSLGCVLLEMAVWSSEVSMADYFSGIRADKSSADIVQYHDSLTRLSVWFQNTPQLTQRTKDIYYQALVHMIRKRPDARWTAVQASRVIGQIVPAECVKCDLDLWVSDTV